VVEVKISHQTKKKGSQFLHYLDHTNYLGFLQLNQIADKRLQVLKKGVEGEAIIIGRCV